MIKTKENLKVKTNKIDAKWYKSLQKRGFTADSIYDKGQHEDLKNRLLEIGGEAVIIWFIDSDKESLLARGECFIEPKIEMRKGRGNSCHSNSAKIWNRKRRRFQICTGYALSDDGIWRQHTWVMDGSTVIETTEIGIAYYGFRLNKEEAKRFYLANPSDNSRSLFF
jgi:hypothetical protein